MQSTPQAVLIPCQVSFSPAYHVLFIPGNPGCIGYYDTFLLLLSKLLVDDQVDIRGYSLANFIDHPKQDRFPEDSKPIGLQGQIDYVETLLRTHLVDPPARALDAKGGMVPSIIIVGHSVGAYIGLEVLRRWRMKSRTTLGKGEVRIVGFLGLWPTVTWIGSSPSGRRAVWLGRLPYVIEIIATLVKIIKAVFSRRIMEKLVKLITGMPDGAAKVTTDLLNSRIGVKQALFMARDEMREITEDRWDEDIWGSSAASTARPSPKLIFYFGRNDHWVADRTRDELIASRASKEGESENWKPKMLIDDEDIPHSFCIHHNSIAANKAAGLIKEIINADQATATTETNYKAV